MSLIDLLLAAEAAQAQSAVRRTAYRHQHVSEKPLVVVVYNLSGEAAAPLGIMYGFDPEPALASLVVSAEPRNRESRFAAVNSFADDFVEFVRPFLALQTVPTRGGGYRQVTASAPQIVVPNRATRAYLGDRIGRSLRYLGLGDTHDVPEATQWTGAHLSWFAQHARLPGQSVFLAMTESLGQHFVTGQSTLEDENLATLLAWIDGVPGDLLTELERLEELAYGPVPNPRWEAKLEPFVKTYAEGLRAGDESAMQGAFDVVAEEVREPLSAAYEATHRAIQILRGIDPAASVAKRWERDVREWGDHARRSARGIPRFARRHDPLRAAATLQKWSSAAEELETDQAFDDALIMARLDAEGRCVTGVVASVDHDNREIKPGGRNRTRVPLIGLSLTAPTRLLVDELVRWTADRDVRGVVRHIDNAGATVAIWNGQKRLAESGLAVGDEVVFVGLDPWEGRHPWTPEEVPWTHRDAAESTSELAGDDSADPNAGAGDDSPDMTLAELAEVPIVGVVGPDADPGVLQ